MSIKIVSWNVNGLRSPSMSVISKDKKFNEECNLSLLIKKYDPDIVCLGETKCQKKNELQFEDIIPFKYKVWNSSIDKLVLSLAYKLEYKLFILFSNQEEFKQSPLFHSY